MRARAWRAKNASKRALLRAGIMGAERDEGRGARPAGRCKLLERDHFELESHDLVAAAHPDVDLVARVVDVERVVEVVEVVDLRAVDTGDDVAEEEAAAGLREAAEAGLRGGAALRHGDDGHPADPEAALDAWAHAVADNPRNPAAWTNWGRLLHEQGQTQRAADVYQRALAQAGPDPLLLFNQGVLLEDLGNPAAALAAYQSALNEDPDLADCHYNLARLYESLGKPQHAIRHLGQYRRLVSSDSR